MSNGVFGAMQLHPTTPSPPSVTFTVPGPPQPKQRARMGRARGTGKQRWYTPDETRRYEEAVKGAAMEAFLKCKEPWPTDRLYRLEVRCYFADGRQRDLDNVTKAVADALNKIAYRDDSQIHAVLCLRDFDAANPRTEVTLQAYEQLAPVPKRRGRKSA